MTLYMLTEDQRQVIILALVELKRRRPGWDDSLYALIDEVFAGHTMRLELERLHDELGAAYSATWQCRVEALETTTHNLSEAVARLEIGAAVAGLDRFRREQMEGGTDAETEADAETS